MEQQSRGTMSVFTRFALLQTLFWVSISAGSFFSVFLQENGYTASMIGMLNAVISAVCIVGIPMWGLISDRIGSIRNVVVILFGVSAALYWIIPAVAQTMLWGVSLSAILGCIVMFFRNPSNAMIDSWTVRGCVENGLNFGPVRAIGSLGYAAMGFVMSAFLPQIGTKWSFVISSVCMIPLLIVIFRIPDTARPVSRNKADRPSLSLLFKNYYYVTYLIFFAGFSVAITCNFVFIPFLIQATGEPVSRMGFINGYSALVEMPMLLLSGMLRRRFPLYKLIIGAALFFTVESILLGFSSGFSQIFIIRTMFGLGNGLLIAGGANYIFSLAPQGLKATAQTVVASVGAIAGIAGNVAGGFLVEALGVGSFYLILGCVFAVMGVVLTLTIVIGKRVLKLEVPSFV